MSVVPGPSSDDEDGGSVTVVEGEFTRSVTILRCVVGQDSDGVEEIRQVTLDLAGLHLFDADGVSLILRSVQGLREKGVDVVVHYPKPTSERLRSLLHAVAD
jgi:hypothetical protein